MKERRTDLGEVLDEVVFLRRVSLQVKQVVRIIIACAKIAGGARAAVAHHRCVRIVVRLICLVIERVPTRAPFVRHELVLP